MEGLAESVITSKGQTTLPKKVRDALGLQPGDKLRYAVLNKGVLVLKVQPIDRLFGILHYDGPPVTLEDMKRGIIEGAVASALGEEYVEHIKDAPASAPAKALHG